VFCFVAASFVVVVIRCASLQLVQHQQWSQLQKQAQSRTSWSMAKRGRIIDRNGLILAEDHLTFRVAIDPHAAARVSDDGSGTAPLRRAIDGVLALPGLVLDHPRQVIEDRIQQACDRNAELLKVPVAERTTSLTQFIPVGHVEGGFDEVKLLEAKSRLHRDLGRSVVPVLEPVVRRQYPFGSRGTLVIGELRGDRAIGLHGIELYYNDQLKERRGLLSQQTDAVGRELQAATEDVPRFHGQDIQLSLGIHEQALLESILEETLVKTGARSVSGIVMDPRDGEIVAMGTYPGLMRGDLQKLWNRGEPELALPRMLQVLHLTMEPGSIVKPLILTAALQNGFKFEDPVDVHSKSQTFDNHRRRYEDSHLLRDRTVLGTVVESSNIGIVDIGRRLGKQHVHRCLTTFGLGRRTGVDLPGEERGRVIALEQWKWHTLSSACFGYAIQVTPIQMIRAYSIIANGGRSITPHLRRDPSIQDKTMSGDRVIPESIAAQARFAMREVMRIGTGKTVGGTVDMAGKTGTAKMNINGEYIDGKYTASFIGFAPWGAPERIAMVVVEEPDPAMQGYYASRTAAPAVRSLLEGVLRSPGNQVQQALEQRIPVSWLSQRKAAAASSSNRRDSTEAGQLAPRRIDPGRRADSLASPDDREQGGEPEAWHHDN
jgi:cell division protein FtsI/penicillin-binding protein 2